MMLWRGSRLGDRFEVVARGDVILEDAAGGDDTVLSHADGYVLSANLESLVLAADAGAAFGVGNGLANRILGNDAANLLIGGAGEDSLAGGAGDDRLFGEAGDDSLLGGLGQDWAYGGDGADSLQGGQGDDTLLGEAGDDLLHGGAGRDWLDGGAGNDLYLIDDATDIVVERADGGSDTVAVGIAGGGCYLAGGIEAMLLLDGTRFGVGNALGNTMLGNAGDNLLLGALGDDDLRGEAGRDSLFGEAGADTLRGGDDADLLLGGGESDSLGGDAGNDTLLGEAGADRLDGGEGADWAFGGGEDDSLSGAAGTDWLDGGVGADSLAGGLDADTLIGGVGSDVLDGGGGADWLDGGEGAESLAGGLDADTLLGGAGSDTLDGGAGADWMLGGADSDLYRVDDPGDVVLDTGSAGWDVATVDIAGGGFALGASSGIEALDLLGTTRFGVGDAAANRITGNAVANLLIGGGSADTIRGGDGDDTLFGGAGTDQFLFGQYASSGAGLADRGTDLIADYETSDSLQFAGVSVVLTWLTAGAVQATFRVGGAWQADSVLLQGDFSDPAALHLGAVSVWDGSLLIDTRAVPGFVPEGTLYARGGVYLTGAAAGGGLFELVPPDSSGGGVISDSGRMQPILYVPVGPPPGIDPQAILATLATLTDLDGTGALALPAPATDQPFA